MQQRREPHGHAGRSAAVLERARAALAGANGLPWDAPSRFRLPGQAARRLLRRVLRPYAMRQNRVDAAIVDGLRAVTDYLADVDDHVHALSARVEQLSRLGQEPNAVQVEYSAAQEIETVAGTLWYHRGDTLIAPEVKRTGLWRPEVSAFLRRRLAPGGSFVDVGAGVGYFSVLAAGLVGDDGQVVAIEPEPHNLTLLRANLWRNGVGNCAVFPVAAHTGQGYITMAVRDGIHDAWFAPGYEGVADPAGFDATFCAPCARLDDLLQGRRVEALRVDVEGAEHLALRGAEETLEANPEALVVVAFLPREEMHLGETREGVLAYYESLGFALNLIDPEGKTRRASADEVISRGERLDSVSLALTRR